MPTPDFGPDFVDGQDATAEVFNDKWDLLKALLDSGVTGLDEDNINLAAIAPLIDFQGGRLKQTTGLVQQTGGAQNLSTSYGDLTGATVTITPAVACHALITATWELQAESDNASNANSVTVEAVGRLVVDGTGQEEARLNRRTFLAVDNSFPTRIDFYGVRGTVTQVYRIPLTAAPHTLKLQAAINNGDFANSFCHQARFIYQLVAQ